MDFIHNLEKSMGRTFKLEFCDRQSGDVESTHADISKLIETTNYKPKTSLKEGVEKFIEWFNDYNYLTHVL